MSQETKNTQEQKDSIEYAVGTYSAVLPDGYEIDVAKNGYFKTLLDLGLVTTVDEDGISDEERNERREYAKRHRVFLRNRFGANLTEEELEIALMSSLHMRYKIAPLIKYITIV